MLYLESLPQSPIGGPVMDVQQSISDIIEPLRKSVSFSILNPVVSLQFRVHQKSMIEPLLAMGLRHDASQGLFVLDLTTKTREQIWNEEFKKHDRQAVKYYEDRASVFSFAKDEGDFVKYQALHQETMSRTGEPSRSLEYLLSMHKNFGERFKIALVVFEHKLVAGFAMICDARSSTVYLGLNVGYSKTKNIHSPIVYMNWKIVNWASDNGFRFVNFGRTDASSKDPVHKLKQKFASEFVPVYRFVLPTSNSPYSIARSIKRLIPGTKNSKGPENE
jgi:lipid II:glycine glycyltransferase (peptidoglycan interpeptide bridge formation enzyme)